MRQAFVGGVKVRLDGAHVRVSASDVITERQLYPEEAIALAAILLDYAAKCEKITYRAARTPRSRLEGISGK